MALSSRSWPRPGGRALFMSVGGQGIFFRASVKRRPTRRAQKMRAAHAFLTRTARQTLRFGEFAQSSILVVGLELGKAAEDFVVDDDLGHRLAARAREHGVPFGRAAEHQVFGPFETALFQEILRGQTEGAGLGGVDFDACCHFSLHEDGIDG